MNFIMDNFKMDNFKIATGLIIFLIIIGIIIGFIMVMNNVNNMKKYIKLQLLQNMADKESDLANETRTITENDQLNYARSNLNMNIYDMSNINELNDLYTQLRDLNIMMDDELKTTNTNINYNDIIKSINNILIFMDKYNIDTFVNIEEFVITDSDKKLIKNTANNLNYLRLILENFKLKISVDNFTTRLDMVDTMISNLNKEDETIKNAINYKLGSIDMVTFPRYAVLAWSDENTSINSSGLYRPNSNSLDELAKKGWVICDGTTYYVHKTYNAIYYKDSGSSTTASFKPFSQSIFKKYNDSRDNFITTTATTTTTSTTTTTTTSTNGLELPVLPDVNINATSDTFNINNYLQCLKNAYGFILIDRPDAPKLPPSRVNYQYTYRGKQNTTTTGESCLAWDGKTINPSNYPNLYLEDGAFCRNPDNSPSLWCYATGSLMSGTKKDCSVCSYEALNYAITQQFDIVETPNLVDRMISGYGDNIVGMNGGSASITLDVDHIPEHNHYLPTVMSLGRASSLITGDIMFGNGFLFGFNAMSRTITNNKQTIGIKDKSNTQKSINLLPPYQKIRYIMKII